MSFQIKSFDTLVADMVAWIVANAPQITDLNPGSVIRSFCEATALSLEELYVSTYLGYKRYLDQIQETIFGFDRKEGVTSKGEVTFGRTGTTGDITIPIGTKVKTPAGLQYVTTEVGTISNGNSTSNATDIEAEEVGTSYNVPSASITVLVDDIDGVETVTNGNATTGGVDIETEYQYKQRFQAYIEGLAGSNIAGLITGALSVDGITSASVTELFPPVANVNVQLYVDDGSSSGVSSAKVTEVQNVIDGDGTEDNPGYRAAGVNVQVIAPTVVTQNIVMTVTAQSGVDTDQMETDINLAITTYVNNLGVGADIIYAELIAAVMGVYGVFNVDITTPTADVTIASSQVGRVGTITVSV
jgi:uncharacterized phage protein gp47/JayE